MTRHLRSAVPTAALAVALLLVPPSAASGAERSCRPAPYAVNVVTGSSPRGDLRAGFISSPRQVKPRTFRVRWRAHPGFRVCRVAIHLRSGRVVRPKSGRRAGRWDVRQDPAAYSVVKRAKLWLRRA